MAYGETAAIIGGALAAAGSAGSAVATGKMNNLQAQNEVIQQDALLKAAQIAQTQKSTAKTEFETQKGQSLLDYSLEAAKENIRKTQVSTQVMLNQDERSAALNSSSIKEALQRISLMRQQEATSVEERNRIRADTNRIINSTETTKLENDLRRKGINPNDSTWMSIISRLLNGGGEPLIDKEKIMSSPYVPINR